MSPPTTSTAATLPISRVCLTTATLPPSTGTRGEAGRPSPKNNAAESRQDSGLDMALPVKTRERAPPATVSW